MRYQSDWGNKMVKNGTSKEVTFKRRFEEETYSDNLGKSSPYGWTSEAPGREGVERGGKWRGGAWWLFQASREGTREGCRANLGSVTRDGAGKEGRSHGSSLNFILNVMGLHQEVSKAIFSSCGVENRQYRNRVEGTQVTKHPLM